MKKYASILIMIAISVISTSLLAGNGHLSAVPSKLTIVFASKAYWDGPSQSCLPRDKGCCFHIGFTTSLLDGQIIGELNYTPGAGLTFTFNKRTGITAATFNELCKSGKFYLDGTGTLSEEILRMLKMPESYSIPSGYYSYRVEGEVVSVTFN